MNNDSRVEPKLKPVPLKIVDPHPLRDKQIPALTRIKIEDYNFLRRIPSDVG